MRSLISKPGRGRRQKEGSVRRTRKGKAGRKIPRTQSKGWGEKDSGRISFHPIRRKNPKLTRGMDAATH